MLSEVTPIRGSASPPRKSSRQILRILIMVIFLCALVGVWALFFERFDMDGVLPQGNR